jgi:hypothetical protein
LESFQLLAKESWFTNRFLRVVVRNINDVDNASSASGPTPDLKPEYEQFAYLASRFLELQKYGGRIELAQENLVAVAAPVLLSPSPIDHVSSRQILQAAETGHQWKRSEDGKWTLWTLPPVSPTLVMRIAPDALDSAEMQEVREILELDPNKNYYRIRTDSYGQFKHPNAKRTSGKPPELREELVISTRSVKEMMFYLSHAIEVPKSHQRLVRQTFDCEGRPFDWREMTGDLLCIHVRRFRPRKASVAVPYNGYWFYIEEGDIDSKRTFDLLLELFNLEIRAGGGAHVPLLSI